jgi:predicted protein tyrosine phosphatase
METIILSTRTVCGIEELGSHQAAGVTHVLSIVDPELPALAAFDTYGDHHRTLLQFHDIIDADGDRVLPSREHVEAILAFGLELKEALASGAPGHLLVHCHMGVSRSTAAMLMLMAQGEPGADEDALFARLREIRPQAWPNSVMIAYADEILGRQGRLTAALRRHYAHQIAHQPSLAAWMRELNRGREVDMAAAA